MSPDSTFCAPTNSTEYAIALSQVKHTTRSAARKPSAKPVSDSTAELSTAEYAMQLYHAAKARYLADCAAVEGDPAFFDRIGELHAGRANG